MEHEDTFSLGEEFNHIMDVHKDINNSLASALAYMRKNFQFSSPRPVKIANCGGWRQFLQDQNDLPSVTGTACILSSIIECGESKNTEIVSLSKRLIVESAREDGGWCKDTLQQHCSQTLITCLALKALLDAEHPINSDPIQRGIQWLLAAQNPDGGWGNLANDNRSDVTSAAYTMKVLIRVLSINSDAEEALYRGQQWVLDSKHQDNSWTGRDGTSGTLAHTSHAVDSLLSSGIQRSNLIHVREWIIDNINQDAEFLELYLASLPNAQSERLNWTHLSKERALIALLKLGSGISEPEVMETAKRILNRQMNGTYWRVDTMPNSAPSWAILEAVTSLHLYQQNIEREGPSYVLSEQLSQMTQKIMDQEGRITLLESRMSAISIKNRLRSALKLLLKPVNVLMMTAIMAFLIYFLLSVVSKLTTYATAITAAATLAGLTLAIYEKIKNKG